MYVLVCNFDLYIIIRANGKKLLIIIGWGAHEKKKISIPISTIFL